ncbi:MAG: copper homeostasis protein CutC [Bacteroidetes bacterium 4572_77]|nr:MAG: copper homeostasis protein CutC [Bacteroidetes bacterium 4572_77]
MKRNLEICCYSAESALLAEKAGADRIELCDNFTEGGTTPSYATIKYAIENLKIPINVIIRPRGGDFLYSDMEYEIMKQEVLEVKKLGVNGIVFGILKSNGEIDMERTKEIMELAYPLEHTFHRAFDMCENHLHSLEILKELGINRVLTSGGENNAYDGIELLSKLVELAGNEIIIMPGSGINKNTIGEILQRTGASEFHSSAKTFISSAMSYLNPDIKMGKVHNIDEYKKISVNTEQIKKMKESLLRN